MQTDEGGQKGRMTLETGQESDKTAIATTGADGCREGKIDGAEAWRVYLATRVAKEVCERARVGDVAPNVRAIMRDMGVKEDDEHESVIVLVKANRIIKEWIREDRHKLDRILGVTARRRAERACRGDGGGVETVEETAARMRQEAGAVGLKARRTHLAHGLAELMVAHTRATDRETDVEAIIGHLGIESERECTMVMIEAVDMMDREMEKKRSPLRTRTNVGQRDGDHGTTSAWCLLM